MVHLDVACFTCTCEGEVLWDDDEVASGPWGIVGVGVVVVLLSAPSIAGGGDTVEDDDDDDGGVEARVVTGCSWRQVKSLSSLLVTIIYCSAGGGSSNLQAAVKVGNPFFLQDQVWVGYGHVCVGTVGDLLDWYLRA